MDDTYTLVAEAEVEAPRAALWDAWKNPEKVAKWWGPEGFTSTKDKHVNQFHADEGSRQLLERLGQQAKGTA